MSFYVYSKKREAVFYVADTVLVAIYVTHHQGRRLSFKRQRKWRPDQCKWTDIHLIKKSKEEKRNGNQLFLYTFWQAPYLSIFAFVDKAGVFRVGHHQQ